MNECFFIGNLTKDPTSKVTPNGRTVCNFSIAVNRRFKHDEVDYFDIEVWQGLAENCAKYLKKGRQVAVKGPMHIDTYINNDGKNSKSVKVIADEVSFLGGNGAARNEDEVEEQVDEEETVEPAGNVDDIPF